MKTNKPVLKWEKILDFEEAIDSYDIFIQELHSAFSVYYSRVEPEGWCFVNKGLKSWRFPNATEAMIGCEEHILGLLEPYDVNYHQLKTHYRTQSWNLLGVDNAVHPKDCQVCWIVLHGGAKEPMTWEYNMQEYAFYDTSHSLYYHVHEVAKWLPAEIPHDVE